MQAVILAGGLGTRLRPFTDSMPKPMIEVVEKPFLEHIILQLKTFEITNVVLLLGYLSEKITDYFGDGSKWGMNITYSIKPVDFDTGARLKGALGYLEDEFMLLYCDNYCLIDYHKAYLQFKNSNKFVQITAYSNKDNYTRNNLQLDDSFNVRIYDKTRTADNLNAVDIGYAFVRKCVVQMLPDTNVNYEKEIYGRLILNNQMSAFLTDQRYASIGSWERIDIAEQMLAERKIIFLDRDGTLNVKAPKACYIEKPEDFEWLPGAIEAIQLLKQAQYYIILITNQPGIARGMLTFSDLDLIHQKMQSDLMKYGISIDQIYYCPHGWDEGCECRKPKPGMIYKAQNELYLNLKCAVLIGDDERDIEAANSANIKGILIDESYTLLDAVKKLLTNIEV